MDNLVEFFSIFSIAQMFMALVLLLPAWKISHALRLYTALMICGILHVVSLMVVPEQLSLWQELALFAGNNALPGVFWLVSLSVFGEHIELRRGHYYVASLTLVIPLVTRIAVFMAGGTYDASSDLLWSIKYAALLLELALLLHALVVVSRYWDSDLVQRRRYIRGGVIGAAALYIFLLIIVEQLLSLHWNGLKLLEVFTLCVLVTTINGLLFQLTGSSIFEPQKATQNNLIEQSPHTQELALIREAMAADKLYQQEGLTISLFSQAVGIQQYKLRSLINGELNYRNFNDFLNHYRVAEVAEKLSDRNNLKLPVLTLALDSGFRSLSSFNKAFKALHGMTPTQYRKDAMTNK